MTRDQVITALSEGQLHHATLTATLVGEALAEPIDGVIAVANVVVNRVNLDIHRDGKPDWWKEGFTNVCLAPWQFSCWHERNVNTDRVFEVAESLILDRPSKLVPISKIAALQWIATHAIAGTLPDLTRGADHYLTTALLRTSPPPWARKNVPALTVIGSHTFFKLEK